MEAAEHNTNLSLVAEAYRSLWKLGTLPPAQTLRMPPSYITMATGSLGWRLACPNSEATGPSIWIMINLSCGNATLIHEGTGLALLIPSDITNSLSTVDVP